MKKSFKYILPKAHCNGCVIGLKNSFTRNPLLFDEREDVRIGAAIANFTGETTIDIEISVTETKDTVFYNQKGRPKIQRSLKAAIRKALKERIEDNGIECEEPQKPQIPQTSQTPQIAQTPQVIKSFWSSHIVSGALGIITGFVLLMLSLFIPAGLPFAATVIIGLGSGLLTLFLGRESFSRALIGLRNRHLSMDSLFALSTIILLSVSLCSFFVPWLPMMFESGLLIFGFRHIGWAIEQAGKKKIGTDKKFKDRLPVEVTVEKEECSLTRKKLTEVQIGDVLVLKGTDIIPVDGIVLEAGVFVNDGLDTGITRPRLLRKEERVFSGVTLEMPKNSRIHLKVTSTLQDSYLYCLDKDIENAEKEKAPIEEDANKILQYFIPGLFILAILAGCVMGAFFTAAIGVQVAVSVLVTACPCTLGLIIPLMVKFGLLKGAEKGLSYKSGKAFQAAKDIDVVIFDLNGTLTVGFPKVAKTHLFNKSSEEDMIPLMAAIEHAYIEGRQKEKLPRNAVATAIYDYAKEKQLDKEKQVKNLSSTALGGLRAEIDNVTYFIGNQTQMFAEGFSLDFQVNTADKLGQVIYFAKEKNKNKELIGCLFLTDSLREGASETVQLLQQMGKEIYLCTGSDSDTAEHYADQLGIPRKNIRADRVAMQHNSFDSTPGDPNEKSFEKKLNKTELLNELKGKRACFVGDGGNDSLMMVESQFSVAILSNSSDPITRNKAGASVRGQSLLPIAYGLAVAEQATKYINRTLLINLLYNLSLLFLASGGSFLLGCALNPGLGIALMIIQTVLVLIIAHWFRQEEVLPHAKAYLKQKSSIEGSHDQLYSNSHAKGNNPNQSVSPFAHLQSAEKTAFFDKKIPRVGSSNDLKEPEDKISFSRSGSVNGL